MNNISNIRYEDDKIAFDYCGQTIFLRDTEVCLVGQPLDVARRWLWKHYGFILQYIGTKE